MSEADLVADARNGDAAAFGALYDRHARLVRAVCFDATGELASAEDLAQDVFLKAHARLCQLRDAERFVAWLCEIARSAGRDWQRRARRESALVSEMVEAMRPAQAGNDAQLAELREVVRTLPDDERMALHLFYLEEQPAAAARLVLGLSQSGFYKLLDRAREHAGAIMRRKEEAVR